MGTQTTRFNLASLGQNGISCITGCDMEPIASDITATGNFPAYIQMFIDC